MSKQVSVNNMEVLLVLFLFSFWKWFYTLLKHHVISGNALHCAPFEK